MSIPAGRDGGTPPITVAPPVPRVGPVARAFRTLLSGDPQGTPDWVAALATGDRDCLVEPDGPSWAVHGSLTTLVGGVRALMLQSLHPAAVTGVAEHSAFEDDTVGRLRRTTRWLIVTTFGDVATATRASAGIRRMHERVTGTYDAALVGGAPGTTAAYSASDADLLRWVHDAFTDSFLTAHLELGGTPIPGGPDAYVAEWAVSAELLGATGLPTTRAELTAQLVVTLFDNVLYEAVTYDRPAPLAALVAHAARFVLRGVGVAEARVAELIAPLGAHPAPHHVADAEADAPVAEIDTRSPYEGPRLLLLQPARPVWSALPLAGARLSASASPERVEALRDGDLSTFWSVAAQRGQREWLELRFEAPRLLGRVELKLGDRPRDAGRGLRLLLSSDGRAFEPVRAWPGRPPTREQVPDLAPPSEVLLIEPRPALALRIERRGGERRWSVAELELSAPGPGVSGEAARK